MKNETSTKRETRRLDTFSDFLDEGNRLSLRTLFLEYEITVSACYCWWCDNQWKIQGRKCSYGLFVFPVKGDIQARVNDAPFLVRPGEFLMISENMLHTLRTAKNSDFSEHFTLRCHISDRWGRSLLERFKSPLGSLPDYPSWMRTLKGLACLTLHDPKFIQQRGESFLRELLAWNLSRDQSVLLPQSLAGDPRVNIVIEMMKREYASAELSIEHLALAAKISSAYLRRLFQQETGVNPKKFLHALRMRKAAHLLSHSSASVKEVSAASGFSSTHYFHPAFYKEFGCTPNVYRQRVANEA